MISVRGFTQEECLEILDVLKEKQDITVDDLMKLGIYTEETRYYRYFFGLFKEDVAGECAALLELSYRLNVRYGTSIYEMSLEEQRMRAEEQMQILTLMVAGLGYSLTEEWLFGPEFDPSMYSPDSMLDMLERDGVNWSFLHEKWVPPSNPSQFITGKIQQHHMLPREFRDQFEEAGLNIEDYKIPLDAAKHTLKPNGIHTGPRSESWNGVWRQFFKEYPNATKGQILDQLEKMRNDFGI